MAFWVILFRSMMAVGLGLALLIQPDKTRPILANFMGMYWLTTGLLTIRWGVQGERPKRRILLAGLLGVVVGLAALTRHVATNYVAEEIILTILGSIIVLTGILHISGGLKARQTQLERPSWTVRILGVLEIVLGLALVISPLERGPILNIAVAAWALLGGLILLADALYIRRQAAKEASSEPVEPEGKGDNL